MVENGEARRQSSAKVQPDRQHPDSEFVSDTFDALCTVTDDGPTHAIEMASDSPRGICIGNGPASGFNSSGSAPSS